METRINMTRILFICQGYAPYYGGAENALTATAETAAKDNQLDVHVLTSDIGGRLSPFEYTNGVSIHRVHTKKKEWTRHSVKELISFYCAAVKCMDKLHKKIAPDYIFAHFSMPAGLVAHKWNSKYKVPYTTILHGSDVPGYQPDRFGMLHFPMQVVARRVWNRADNVVAVGKPLKELAMKTWEGPISVIPNGVDGSVFFPADNEVPENGVINFALTAQLIPRKGIGLLVEAVDSLSPEHKAQVKVNIYGTGPMLEELLQLIDDKKLKNNIALCGLIAREDMNAVLQTNQMFIMSSLQEGLPLSLLEAMACGLVPISTAVGDIASVIKNYENGILIEPGKPEAIKTAIEYALDNRDSIRKMRDKTLATAAHYSWDRIWSQYKALI